MRDSYVALGVSAADRYSARLLDAIDRCLAVRPEDRPQSVAQLRELLAPSRHRMPAKALPEDRNEAAPEHRPGRRRLHIAVSGLLATGLLGAWLLSAGEAVAPERQPVPPAQEAAQNLSAPQAAPSEKAAATPDLDSAWLAATQASSADFALTVSGLRSSLQVGRDSLELELRSARAGCFTCCSGTRQTARSACCCPTRSTVSTGSRPARHSVCHVPAGATSPMRPPADGKSCCWSRRPSATFRPWA